MTSTDTDVDGGDAGDGLPVVVRAYSDLHGLDPSWADDLVERRRDELDAAESLSRLRDADVDPVGVVVDPEVDDLYEAIAPDMGRFVDVFRDPALAARVSVTVYDLFATYLDALADDEAAATAAHELHVADGPTQMSVAGLQTTCENASELLSGHAETFAEQLRAWQYRGVRPERGSEWVVFPATDVASYRLLDTLLDGPVSRERRGLTFAGEVLGFDSTDELYQDNSMLFDAPAQFRIHSVDGELPPNAPFDADAYEPGMVARIMPGAFRYGEQVSLSDRPD